MNENDPRLLISAYLDGELSESDAPRLAAWLGESREHVREFARETHLHRQLRDMTMGHAAHAALSPMAELAGRRRQSSSTSHVGLFLGFAAALCVAVGLWTSRPHPIPAETPDDAFATVSADFGCEWKEGAPAFPQGTRLRPGDRLRLARGVAEINFDDGARFVARGPTELTLTSSAEGFLKVGEISVALSEDSTGFTLRTPSATVVDLGTAFGVRVDLDGQAEIQVFQGAVEARWKSWKGQGEQKLALQADQAARIDPSRGLLQSGRIEDVSEQDLRPAALLPKPETLAEYKFKRNLPEPTGENHRVLASPVAAGPGCRIAFAQSDGRDEAVLRMTDVDPLTSADAVAAGDYVELTVSAKPGWKLIPTSFSYKHRADGEAPRWTCLRWSVDNFYSDLNGPVLAHGDWEEILGPDGATTLQPRRRKTNDGDFGKETVSLPRSAVSSVTFRVYGFLRQDQRPGQVIGLDDLKIHGIPLPDPQSEQ